MHRRLKEMNPDLLIRHYIRMIIVSTLVILGLTSFGSYQVYQSRIIATAEERAVSLANALMVHEIENLSARDAAGTMELEVTRERYPLIDRSLRQFLPHFAILKIKIYDRKAKIIYSTEGEQLGKVDAENRRLANALAGRADSAVVRGDNVLDLNRTQKFAVDVVETYIPVRDGMGRVVGAFELYQDVTRNYREVGGFIAISSGILLVILVWVFAISFVLIRKEARQLTAVQEVLKDQANTDVLTGIFNRRYLLSRCEDEMLRVNRQLESSGSEGSISFIMVDIDHFKQINDRCGHAAGDVILREVAERLKDGLRQYDIVGRYGGEEFLVVLPNADAEQLALVANRLWNNIRSQPFHCQGEELAVTVSLGGAVFRAGDKSYEQTIRRADEALYRSKEDGRNRITCV